MSVVFSFNNSIVSSNNVDTSKVLMVCAVYQNNVISSCNSVSFILSQQFAIVKAKVNLLLLYLRFMVNVSQATLYYE